MHMLAFPFLALSWLDKPRQLRIDVDLDAAGLEKELDALHGRLNLPGAALQDLPLVDIDLPGLAMRYREADGEHYVYVEDRARKRLAGYTVFNRLIEVDRRADRVLRAPHSRYGQRYQRRGIATAIYRWWLDGGRCLISGARQSAGANALWHALKMQYPLIYVELRNKSLRYLGAQVDRRTLDSLHTRMILLGKGWDIERLAQGTGMAACPPGRKSSTRRQT